jgi:stress up-regulated protein Nod 19
MKRVRSRLIAMVAAAIVGMPLGLAAPSYATPPPGAVPSYCLETETGYRCTIGPFDVAAGERLEIMTGVAAPSAAGFITAARPSLVDRNGRRVAPHMVHLHHAVWLNPYEDDMTCDSYDGGFPDYERFFATGKELTDFVLPRGHGYFWDPQLSQPYTQSAPWWAFVAHLDGMHGSSEVYVELELGFVPEDEGDKMTKVRPVWLDVRNCSSEPVYTVKKGSGRRGVHRETWSYRMPVGGRLVFMGGHLHDGGLRLRASSRSGNMFTSRAVYGNANDPWFLTRMTTKSWSSGIRVNKGERLTLTSVYDSSRTRRDVMGIMLGALVVD